MYFENSEHRPRKCVSHIMDIIMLLLFLDSQIWRNNLSPLSNADILKEIYLKNQTASLVLKYLTI